MHRRHAGPGSLGQERLTNMDLYNNLQRRSHGREQDQRMPQIAPEIRQAYDQQTVQDTGQATVVAQCGLSPPQPEIDSSRSGQQG